jgi:hypothetical protein
VKWNSWHYDPFGNQKRYDISVDDAVEKLLEIRSDPLEVVKRTHNARTFMENKDWSKSVRQLADAIEAV